MSSSSNIQSHTCSEVCCCCWCFVFAAVVKVLMLLFCCVFFSSSCYMLIPGTIIICGKFENLFVGWALREVGCCCCGCFLFFCSSISCKSSQPACWMLLLFSFCLWFRCMSMLMALTCRRDLMWIIKIIRLFKTGIQKRVRRFHCLVLELMFVFLRLSQGEFFDTLKIWKSLFWGFIKLVFFILDMKTVLQKYSVFLINKFLGVCRGWHFLTSTVLLGRLKMGKYIVKFPSGRMTCIELGVLW